MENKKKGTIANESNISFTCTVLTIMGWNTVYAVLTFKWNCHFIGPAQSKVWFVWWRTNEMIKFCLHTSNLWDSDCNTNMDVCTLHLHVKPLPTTTFSGSNLATRKFASPQEHWYLLPALLSWRVLNHHPKTLKSLGCWESWWERRNNRVLSYVLLSLQFTP